MADRAADGDIEGAGPWQVEEAPPVWFVERQVALEVHLNVRDVFFRHLFIYRTSSLDTQPSFPAPKCSKLPIEIPLTTV